MRQDHIDGTNAGDAFGCKEAAGRLRPEDVLFRCNINTVSKQ